MSDQKLMKAVILSPTETVLVARVEIAAVSPVNLDDGDMKIELCCHPGSLVF